MVIDQHNINAIKINQKTELILIELPTNAIDIIDYNDNKQLDRFEISYMINHDNDKSIPTFKYIDLKDRFGDFKIKTITNNIFKEKQVLNLLKKQNNKTHKKLLFFDYINETYRYFMQHNSLKSLLKKHNIILQNQFKLLILEKIK